MKFIRAVLPLQVTPVIGRKRPHRVGSRDLAAQPHVDLMGVQAAVIQDVTFGLRCVTMQSVWGAVIVELLLTCSTGWAGSRCYTLLLAAAALTNWLPASFSLLTGFKGNMVGRTNGCCYKSVGLGASDTKSWRRYWLYSDKKMKLSSKRQLMAS
jgi:hypothetical protein